MSRLAAAVATPDLAQVQRRTLAVLVGSQTLGGLGNTVGIAVAAVLAEQVSGSATLAGSVQTLQVLGAALFAYRLAALMGRRGRRAGLVAGYLVGATGSAVMVAGGALSSFALLAVGALLLGSTSATNYQARYAAADLAAPEHRARALAVVLWATTFGAVLGPNLTGPAGDLARVLGLPVLTGPFVLSVAVVLVAAVVVQTLLRPDPLLLARSAAGLSAAGERRGLSRQRFVTLLQERPRIAAGVLGLATSHAVMIAVMVMTPLHMHHGGATLDVIGFVLSVHVLGMFFFAPAVGWAADRVGRTSVLLVGAAVLAGSLVLSGSAPEGASVRIGVGLFLLGLGWSCCTVASSALVVEAAPLEERTGVQGAADLCMNVAGAAAGLAGGVVVDLLGFAYLAALGGLLVLGVLAAAALAHRAR